MDGRQGRKTTLDPGARRALEDALDQYLGGRADLETAAARAGMDQFDFLNEAGALPDPVATDGENDLPTFVRDRNPHAER